MKYMVTWTPYPGSLKELAAQFVKDGGAPQEGVKLLGRWHGLDVNGGFALYETDNPVQLFKGALRRAELLDFTVTPVIEDAEAGPVIAEWSKG